MSVPGGPAPAAGRGHTRRRTASTAALAAVLVLAAGCVRADRDAPTPQETQEAPRRQALAIGLPLNPAELDQQAVQRAVDLARRAGATELGAGVSWWYVTQRQPPGRYDWQALDRLVDTARASGMRVRLQLSGTPDRIHPELVATVPNEADRIWYPPRTPAQLQAWGEFVGDTVRHFGNRVTSYELWNEPNIDPFWKPASSPAEYARLLAQGYRSAKGVLPSATVVFGGLSRNDAGYLRQFYVEAGRLFPDAGANHYFFDLMNVHPYSSGRSPDDNSPDALLQGRFGEVDRSFAGMRLIKSVMDDTEDDRQGAGKNIVIGEYGFTAGPSTSQAVVPDRRRAYYLKRAVANARQLPFVTSLFWYAFVPDSSTPPGWGIADDHGPPTWTYLALQDIAIGSGGPGVRFADPGSIRPGGGPIRPALTGLRPTDVVHTELYLDGVLTAQADGPELRWTSPAAPHADARAQLVVYTRDRHAWPSDIVTVGR